MVHLVDLMMFFLCLEKWVEFTRQATNRSYTSDTVCTHYIHISKFTDAHLTYLTHSWQIRTCTRTLAQSVGVQRDTYVHIALHFTVAFQMAMKELRGSATATLFWGQLLVMLMLKNTYTTKDPGKGDFTIIWQQIHSPASSSSVGGWMAALVGFAFPLIFLSWLFFSFFSV